MRKKVMQQPLDILPRAGQLEVEKYEGIVLFSVFTCQPVSWLSWFFYRSVHLILKNTVELKAKFETMDPHVSCLWV